MWILWAPGWPGAHTSFSVSVFGAPPPPPRCRTAEQFAWICPAAAAGVVHFLKCIVSQAPLEHLSHPPRRAVPDSRLFRFQTMGSTSSYAALPRFGTWWMSDVHSVVPQARKTTLAFWPLVLQNRHQPPEAGRLGPPPVRRRVHPTDPENEDNKRLGPPRLRRRKVFKPLERCFIGV